MCNSSTIINLWWLGNIDVVQGEYLSKIHRQELLEDIQDAEQEDAQPIEDDSPSPVTKAELQADEGIQLRFLISKLDLSCKIEQ